MKSRDLQGRNINDKYSHTQNRSDEIVTLDQRSLGVLKDKSRSCRAHKRERACISRPVLCGTVKVNQASAVLRSLFVLEKFVFQQCIGSRSLERHHGGTRFAPQLAE